MKFNVRALAVVALLAFVIGALFIAACGDDDTTDDASAADQAALDAVKDQATKAQILAAETVYRVDGLHQLDDDVGEATEIDPQWLGAATRMRRATVSVEWPDSMKDEAATLLEKLVALEAALKAENLDDAKTYAPEAHEAYHELDHLAYPYIAGEAAESEQDEASATGDAGHAEEENSPSATASN